MALKERLGTDRSLQPLLAQYVPLNLEQGTPEWTEWYRKYRDESDSIPIMFVVRADGEKLFGNAAPRGDELPQFLQQQLGNSGHILNSSQLDQLSKAHADALKLEGEGDMNGAIERLSRVAGSGSFAKPAVAVEEMIAGYVKKAEAVIAEAEQKLSSSDGAIDGAIALLEAQRIYGRLPAVAKPLNQKLSTYRRDAATRVLFAQAALIDQAKDYEAKNMVKQAVAKYQQVVSAHAATPAAELAQARIAELENGSTTVVQVSAQSAVETPEGPTPAAEADERKAAYYLRMANAFVENNPGKARQYAQRLLDEQPGSQLVGQAKALLEKLPAE